MLGSLFFSRAKEKFIHLYVHPYMTNNYSYLPEFSTHLGFGLKVGLQD